MNQTPQNNTIPSNAPRRLWVVWVLFFFQFAAIGAYFTYLAVYYRAAGLSGTQIGMINMAGALVMVGSSVIWGMLADRTGRHRLLIAGGALGSLLINQAIPFADRLPVPAFTVYLALTMLATFFNAAPTTLVDGAALAMLGARRDEYGRYRLGGSVGYVIAGLSAGFLFDRVDQQWMFPIYGVIMLGFAAAALLLPRLPVRIERHSNAAIGRMVRTPAWLLFTASIFLVWIAVNSSITFLPVALRAMGASTGLIGIAVTINAIIEIPFMLFSGRFLRRFGPVRLLVAAMGMMTVRYLLLVWIPTPEWGVVVNMLSGPSFVFFWNSSVTYANRMAPPGMDSTAQGLLSATSSLAGVVAALVAGWTFDLLGPNNMFLVMASCVLAALLLFTLGSLPRRSAGAVNTSPRE